MEDARLHHALMDSLRLSKGQQEEALRLVDTAIIEAMKEGDDSSVQVLVNHAALLNGVKRDLSLLKHYYEKYLTYSPENPRALYGLADIALKDGHAGNAKTYAKRCYEALLKSNNQKVKKDLLDLVVERWPEVCE